MYSLCKPAISMCHSGILHICCVPTRQMCITHFLYQNIWENMLRYLARLCIEGDSVQSSGTSFKKNVSDKFHSLLADATAFVTLIGHVPACHLGVVLENLGQGWKLLTCFWSRFQGVHMPFLCEIQVLQVCGNQETLAEFRWTEKQRPERTKERKSCIATENSSSPLWNWENLFQRV